METIKIKNANITKALKKEKIQTVLEFTDQYHEIKITASFYNKRQAEKFKNVVLDYFSDLAFKL